MSEPRYFPDEIAERLAELKHGDKIVIKYGDHDETLTCLETARYEDGIASTFRRFETRHRSVVDRIVDRLYDASENGKELYVVIDGKTEIF